MGPQGCSSLLVRRTPGKEPRVFYAIRHATNVGRGETKTECGEGQVGAVDRIVFTAAILSLKMPHAERRIISLRRLQSFWALG